MQTQSRILLVIALFLSMGLSAFVHADDAKRGDGQSATPLRILLINGGCCHDYPAQGPAIKEAIESKLNAEVTIGGTSSNKTDARFDVYKNQDWAKGYDLVIHNECTANVKDPVYVKRILDAHRAGTPAVNIHCAMHSYRWGDYRKPVKVGADNAHWFEMIGLQSTAHGPRETIDVKYEKVDHPILKGLKNWTTPKGELYNNIQIFDGATVLAKGVQALKGGRSAEAAIVWTNTYGPKKTKVFSVSIGHTSAEIRDANFAELLRRGVLWTTGNINPDGSAKNGLAK